MTHSCTFSKDFERSILEKQAQMISSQGAFAWPPVADFFVKTTSASLAC